MPSCGGYLVSPASAAWCAASIACGGLSKFGSPVVSVITGLPAARSSRALIVIWTLAASLDPAEPLGETPASMSVQSLAEALDAGHRLAQFLGRVGIADADIAGVAERRAMHRRDPFLGQQRQRERLVILDQLAALAGLADAAMDRRDRHRTRRPACCS